MSDEFAPVPSNELWLCHYACVSWLEVDRWTRYLERVQAILGAEISHLDKDDPARRRVRPGTLADLATYVTSIGKREESRWVFGRLETIGIDFTVRHYRDVRGWPNSINWYIPPAFVNRDSCAGAIRSLFDCGNEMLSPFYAYSDTKDVVARKKRESGAINIQAELIGAFWLSYFDTHYVTFIGEEKFRQLDRSVVVFDRGGVTLCLGETPATTESELRSQTESTLGSRLFVQSSETLTKRPGQYALTFEQLRA